MIRQKMMVAWTKRWRVVVGRVSHGWILSGCFEDRNDKMF